jgi:integrase
MRTHKPWFRSTHGWWYVEVNGKQIKLAKGHENETAAYQAFYKLMAADQAQLKEPATIRVATVCDLFLDFSERHHVPLTHRWYKDYLQDFCDTYGTMNALDLKPLHVHRWLDAHVSWKGGRRNAVIAIKRTFNWAEAEGVLPTNPLKHVKKPPATFRKRILTPEERQQLLAAIRDQPFRDLVLALMLSGGRPMEMAGLTAAQVNLTLGVIILDHHKTREKTDAPRVIYMTPDLRALVRRQIGKYPEGPLFRGPRSQAGFTPNGIRCRFRLLREKHAHLKGIIPYSLRHTYCTDGLANGVPIATMAELMGHKDIKMIQRHYGHLEQKVNHLREAAQQAVPPGSMPLTA